MPKKDEKILTNIEKMRIKIPQKELATLQKVTKKSIATQTIDFMKVNLLFYYFIYIYIYIYRVFFLFHGF